jgi:hypothetical protein
VQAQPGQTAQSEQRQDTGVTAELLRTGWGRMLLILVGVLAVAAGVETGRRSVRLDFQERFTAEHMPRALAMLTRALGAVGCVVRAVVFVLVGVFLLKAAVLSSAKQAKGLDAVFRSAQAVAAQGRAAMSTSTRNGSVTTPVELGLEAGVVRARAAALHEVPDHVSSQFPAGSGNAKCQTRFCLAVSLPVPTWRSCARPSARRSVFTYPSRDT